MPFEILDKFALDHGYLVLELADGRIGAAYKDGLRWTVFATVEAAYKALEREIKKD